MEKFKKLNLSEGILKAIEAYKFHEPSEIQEKAIPLILEGKDVVGSSATGSGKTLAFGAGIIEQAKTGEGIQALVLTPTRELAEQVADSLRNFAYHFNLNIKEIYGGVAIGPQISALRHTEVVVGTPGRILDLLERRALNLERLKILVLDEADRMLDMGFIEDVNKIISQCPKKRQTLLFSATISADIEHIAFKYMKDPVYIEAKSYVDASKLTQIYYDVPDNLKFSLLVHLLKKEQSGLVMVFCNTRRTTELITKNLRRYDIEAVAIHGGLSQNKRSNTLDSFHSHKSLILVCTDVAARGLDIKNVSHIYNYDSPKTSVDYIHRIGRTARAGEEGKAISLLSSRDYDNFRNVMSDESLKITSEKVPKLEPLSLFIPERRRFGSRFSSRNNPRNNFRNRRRY